MLRTAAVGVAALALVTGASSAAQPESLIAYAGTDGCPAPHTDVFAMHADGTAADRLTHTCLDGEPAWSPDGTQIAFSSTRDGSPELFVMHADGSGGRQVTPAGQWASSPSWSRQGMLAFSDLAAGIDTIAPDGTRLTKVTPIGKDPSWSADGSRIAYTYDDKSTGYRDVVAIVASGGGTPQTVAVDALAPVFSPDGAHLAWAGRNPQTGQPTIVVGDATGGSPTVVATLPLATTYAVDPAWSPDSRSLVFRSGGADDLYTVSIQGGAPTRLTSTAAIESDPAWQPVVPSTGLVLARIAFRQRACAAKPGAATVTVTDGQGRPLAGAVVTAPGTRAVTRPNGSALISPHAARRRGRLAFTVRAVVADRPAASRHVSLPGCR